MMKLFALLAPLLGLAACDPAVALPQCPPVNENVWTFADRNGFGLLVFAAILIWSIERVATAFANRNKPPAPPEDGFGE